MRAQIAAIRQAKVHFLDEAARPGGETPAVPRLSGEDAASSDPLFALDVLARILERLSPAIGPAAPTDHP